MMINCANNKINVNYSNSLYLNQREPQLLNLRQNQHLPKRNLSISKLSKFLKDSI